MSNAGRPKLEKEIKEARGTLEKSRELPEERAMKPLKVNENNMICHLKFLVNNSISTI